MSNVSEQWANLSVDNIDQSGYTAAIAHYNDLRNKMIEQFKQRALASGVAEQYLHLEDIFENEILQNTSSFGEGFKQASETLARLESAISKIIADGNTDQVYNVLNEIRSKITEKEGKLKNVQQTLKLALNKNQTQIFEALGLDRNFVISMLSTSGTSGDINDLANQASSYFIRALYTRLFDDKTVLSSNFKYLMSMGGYYKELHEYEALEKVLSSYLNVVHGGGIKIEGKDTELDIFITNLDKIEALNRNAAITQEIMALPQDRVDVEQLRQQLLKEIDWFGEQVKSRSLGKSDVFEIGNRAGLYGTFKGEGFNPGSSLQAIHFLARFQNILLALGQSNVLFSSNNKRQWMSDFIADFRRQNYMLTFMRKTNKGPLTQTVGLEQLYTQKNAIKRRFLS